MSKEINFIDLEDYPSYYEVDLWGSGDCDSHFFHYRKEAIDYFNKHKSHKDDNVKHFECSYYGDYECQLIKENNE